MTFKRMLLSTASVRPYITIASQTEEGRTASAWAVHWLADVVRAMQAIPSR